MSFNTRITGRYLELLASPTKEKWERETRRREELLKVEGKGGVCGSRGFSGRRPGQKRRPRVMPGSRFGKGKERERKLEREVEVEMRGGFSQERLHEIKEMWSNVYAEFRVPGWVVETLRSDAEREAEAIMAEERELEEWRMQMQMEIEMEGNDVDVVMSGTC